MPNITSISGIAANLIVKRSGHLKANITSLASKSPNRLNFSPSLTEYVSNGMELHLNALDSNSYSGPNATTWNDISGNSKNVTLVNNPSEPSSGDGYVVFDGVDEYGTITWDSTDYFYGSSTDYTYWDEYSYSFVCSWPENGTTGFIPSDSVVRFGSRQQNNNMRALWMQMDIRGIWIALAYGSNVFFYWPSNDSANFQYNSSAARYEPKPNRVIHGTLTMDRTTSPHVITYLNGQTYTVGAWQGSYASGTNTGSQTNLTFINNSNVRKGPATWYLMHTQGSNGSLVSSTTNGYLREVLMYNRRLSSTEVTQNYDAYIDRYGSLN
jgi:hypothetical protein